MVRHNLVDKELFLRGGRPADHGKIVARQAPYGVRVALIDGVLCEFGAVVPLFFHGSRAQRGDASSRRMADA